MNEAKSTSREKSGKLRLRSSQVEFLTKDKIHELRILYGERSVLTGIDRHVRYIYKVNVNESWCVRGDEPSHENFTGDR